MCDRAREQAKYVRSYLDRPGFHLTGTDMRIFAEMGDRVAVAISSEVNAGRLLEPWFVQKVLAAISVAFEYTGGAEAEDDDRIPTATESLLRGMMAGDLPLNEKSCIRAVLDKITRREQ